jgi:hypothetical protein
MRCNSGAGPRAGTAQTARRARRRASCRHDTKKWPRARAVPRARHVVPARHEHELHRAASCSCRSCPCQFVLVSGWAGRAKWPCIMQTCPVSFQAFQITQITMTAAVWVGVPGRTWNSALSASQQHDGVSRNGGQRLSQQQQTSPEMLQAGKFKLSKMLEQYCSISQINESVQRTRKHTMS